MYYCECSLELEVSRFLSAVKRNAWSIMEVSGGLEELEEGSWSAPPAVMNTNL